MKLKSCWVVASSVMLALAGCSSPGNSGVPWPQDTGNPWIDHGVSGDGGGSDVYVEPDVPPLPTDVPCDEDSDCPAQVPYCGEDFKCNQCQSDNDCLEGTCDDGFCKSDPCEPLSKKCNANNAMHCKADGTGWYVFPCGDGTCVNGDCTLCVPGERKCELLVIKECAENGMSWELVEECPAEQKCLEGACIDCYPGALRCVESVVEKCSEAGQWAFEEDCAAQGLGCAMGTCWDPCLVDLKDSNAGCDYWAVNTDNISDAYEAPNYQYSIVVANFGTSDVNVKVFKKDSATGSEDEVASAMVAGDGLQIIDLPNRIMDDPGIHYAAYRVRSTGPIVAAQFNPLENVEVYSNDASLLLPANTFGTEYVVVSRFEFCGGDPCYQWRGWAAVVTGQEDTTVTVTPSVAVLAGGASLPANQPHQFTIGPYQVLNVKSDVAGYDFLPGTDSKLYDMTGTIITSDKPIGVYSGHDAAISGAQCCADHLEQQLFPTNTWGKTYVAGHSFPRGVENDYWRIVASQNGTTVSFTPAVTSTKTINRGDFVEIATDKDFLISSDKPVMVAQTLASSYEVGGASECTSAADCAPGWTCDGLFIMECTPPTCTGPSDSSCPSGTTCACDEFGIFCGCAPIGDPALILAPPVEQFRMEYIFLTPNKYLNDYITIVAPQSAIVSLDGNSIPPGNYQSISGTTWKVGRVKINDGVHKLQANEPVGLTSYGYDDDVSYGYTAGLNLGDTTQ